jgi:tetratricopeptide (TPR) repeat protein
MQSTRLVLALMIAGCSLPVPEPDPAVVAPPSAPAAPAAPAVVAAGSQTRRTVPVREPVAAWSLTASDGSGLRLVSVEAKAVIEGPLAFTELHLRFHNPEDRIREGTFAITLPSRAAVSRFAMLEDGRMKEAEVVPKALARRAYDDFLHRGIDPAILEKAAGNEFTARVFPIPAHASKDIVISYSQELAASAYVLPLRGLPKIDDVSVTLRAVRPGGSPQTQTLRETSWQPDRDFVADVVTPAAIAAGTLVAATFEADPAAGAAAADRPSALTLLVDTSASRAPGFRRYLDRVRALVAGLAERYDPLAVEIVAFDQEARSMYSGPARDFGDAQIAALAERRAAGASDLAQAAASLQSPRRIAIVTDGVVTAGAEGADLAKALRKLGAERIDVILAGGIRDEQVAAAISRTGARPGDVFDLDAELEPIADELGEAVRVDVPIDVPGATWFHPRTVASLRSGTQVTVFARMASPAGSFAVTIGGSARTAPVIQGTPALLERAAARAEIDELEVALAAAAAEPARAKLRKQIEQRSVEARVVSSQATMLVLDTDADYARYGIDRQALADILVIGPRGLEQSQRTFVASKSEPPRRQTNAPLTREEQLAQARSAGTSGASRDEALAAGMYGAIGAGTYGTIGHGFHSGESFSGGSGSYRATMRSRVAAAPAVSLSLPSISAGSLDRNIIRRYVKRNIAKISYCYERQLLGNPRLEGTMQTRFTIGTTGRVLAVTVTGIDEEVATCVASVIRSIEFPPVGDSTVIVNYPFTFRRAGAPADEGPPPNLAQDLAALDRPAPAVAAQPPTPAPAAPATSATPATPSAPAITAPDVPVSDVPDVPAAPASPAVPAASPAAVPAADDPQAAPAATSPVAPPAQDEPAFGPPASALDGKLARVMTAIAKRDAPGALALAKAWRDEQPTDILALIGLGEAFEYSGDRAAAARAYGSIIDLYPTRADFRRFAGERLERLGPTSRALAIDTYRRAVADRPDQLTGHRLLAYALLRNSDYNGAFAAILAGVDQQPPADRFAGAPRVLAGDAGMIAAAYLARGGNRDRIEQALTRRSLALVTAPSTRFVLYWETDANDVDLHVRDAAGGHAWYSHKTLESGGELFADVTTGFGPECFELPGAPAAGPYRLGVHYYAQGPMGYGMGLLQIVRFDGQAFSFDDRPYVIMKNQAYVSLGQTR